MTATALVGWTLIIGSVAFGIGASNPYLARAWTAPQHAFLTIVAARPGAWRFSNLLFMAGTLMIAAGLAAVPGLIVDDVSRGLAVGGAVVFGIAATLWTLSLLSRLSLTPDVAREFVDTGEVDPAGEPLDRLTGALFKAFMVIGLAGVAAIGIGMAADGLVPAVVGWGSAVVSALLVAGLVITGDMPPFTLYVLTLAYGIAIVLR